MPNNSSTGGYLVPDSSQGLPGGLTLDQFIQTVIVGITGLTNTLVRPKFQIAPPKQPDITANWVAFDMVSITPGANAYNWMTANDTNQLQRQEQLEVQLSFYGPQAQEILTAFRDGFQIQQNLEALRAANMGYVGVGNAIQGPDLINERFVNRWEMTLTLTRQVQRIYPILSFASAYGFIHTVIDDELVSFEWTTPPEEI